MSVLTSPRTYAVLSTVSAVDAVACAIPLAAITSALDTVGLPERIRPVLPVVKAVAAVGLVSVTRFPRLARLTTAMLTVYFVLALGSHIRVQDKVVNSLPSAFMLATFAVMTAKGPDQR
jgi:DoxX-like family